jgi:hypothetical protein
MSSFFFSLIPSSFSDIVSVIQNMEVRGLFYVAFTLKYLGPRNNLKYNFKVNFL